MGKIVRVDKHVHRFVWIYATLEYIDAVCGQRKEIEGSSGHETQDTHSLLPSLKTQDTHSLLPSLKTQDTPSLLPSLDTHSLLPSLGRSHACSLRTQRHTPHATRRHKRQTSPSAVPKASLIVIAIPSASSPCPPRRPPKAKEPPTPSCRFAN